MKSNVICSTVMNSNASMCKDGTVNHAFRETVFACAFFRRKKTGLSGPYRLG